MRDRIYHDIQAGEAFDRVLISQHDGRLEASVYCPPIGNERAFTKQFASRDEAERFASFKARQIGQRVIPLTADRIEWWLPTDGGVDVGGD